MRLDFTSQLILVIVILDDLYPVTFLSKLTLMIVDINVTVDIIVSD